MNNKYYITTTLPYVNSDPHIGFALEIIHADILARYHILKGDEVFFNTGTDEHGVKIFRKAEEQGKDAQSYVDEYASRFKELKERLGISDVLHFIRTTDVNHKEAAQEFWRRCLANGYIYKKNYEVKYCVGCELEKTDSELDSGKCPLHPNLEIENISEENYFFKFSDFQKPLLELYAKNSNFVVPDSRFNEIKKFVEAGLQDFSISRLKTKMPWGVAIPDDESQVMYVWFDALVNYISTLGWPKDGEQFEKFWGTKDQPNAIQIAGKDNLRQQSAMWQAMLLAAGLPTSRQIIIHGFITSGGHKMSKSLGNVVAPYEVINKLEAVGLTNEQAIDALRYYLAREIPTFEDGDFTWERFVESYNANLANGIGNLASRILKMAQNTSYIASQDIIELNRNVQEAVYTFDELETFNIDKAMDDIWFNIQLLDKYIQINEPYKKAKTDLEGTKEDMHYLIYHLKGIAIKLQPFMPRTAKILLSTIDTSTEVPRLFPRIQQ